MLPLALFLFVCSYLLIYFTVQGMGPMHTPTCSRHSPTSQLPPFCLLLTSSHSHSFPDHSVMSNLLVPAIACSHKALWHIPGSLRLRWNGLTYNLAQWLSLSKRGWCWSRDPGTDFRCFSSHSPYEQNRVGPSFGRGQDLPGRGEMGHVLVWLGKTEGAGKLWGEGCEREQVKPLL